MANDTKSGGSDLDIFEGLGKKSAERPAAAPPPPPASTSNVPAPPPARGVDPKKTLLGIPGPAIPAPVPAAAASQPPPLPPGTRPSGSMPAVGGPPPLPPVSAPPPSGSLRAAAAASSPASPSKAPPPPPGRASLPNIPGTRPSAAPEPPPSSPSAAPKAANLPPLPGARPSAPPPSRPANGPAAGALKKNGAKMEMDWDDDQETTHVFDKEDEKGEKSEAKTEGSAQALTGPDTKEGERASMGSIMSSPPPAKAPSSPPAPPAPESSSSTLSGAFGSLGQPRDKSNGSAPSGKLRTASAPSGRSAPPPPPGASAPPPPPAAATGPLPPGASRPPPPPGQTTTAPMHMPPSASVPPAAAAPAAPPPASLPPQTVPSQAPAQPSMPPVASAVPAPRAMEATQIVHREASKTPTIIALLVAVMAIVGAAVFLLMPRSGTLVVNVADSKGAAVQSLEVHVDGAKRCDSAPCIVRDVPSGVHEVKVLAKGYELAAPRAITVDKRDVTMDFQLVAAKATGGTGFKVAARSSGVKLSVDGKDVGTLPQELRDLEAGEHKLRFTGDRYAPLDKTISVAKDEVIDLGTVDLKVLKGKATIQLGTPGAKVYLVNGTNRKEVPQFPMAIEFDPNEKWELQATKDGFDEYKERISFDDGQAEKTFTVTLSPKGTRAPTFVAAQPAPQPAAPTPKAAPAAVKEPAAPKATKAAGGEAVLKINSLPASSIVLDGKPIGVTPQAHVVVSPGTHTIMFVNSEQSLKKTITVDVKAGETKAAFAKLRE